MLLVRLPNPKARNTFQEVGWGGQRGPGRQKGHLVSSSRLHAKAAQRTDKGHGGCCCFCHPGRLSGSSVHVVVFSSSLLGQEMPI